MYNTLVYDSVCFRAKHSTEGAIQFKGDLIKSYISVKSSNPFSALSQKQVFSNPPE